MSGSPCYLGCSLVLHLGSGSWPFSFTKLKVTMENATIDPWRSVRRAKALVWPLLSCTGVKRAAQLARQQTRLPWPPLTRSPLVSSTVGRPARGNGQTHVSFSLWSPVLLQDDPYKGCIPDYSGGYVVCTPHLEIRLLGRVVQGWLKDAPFYPV